MKHFRSLVVASFALMGIVTAQTACYDPHAHDSKLVREVEAAGSGDIDLHGSGFDRMVLPSSGTRDQDR